MDTARRRNILVTDGEQRASLAVVRSLGAQGHVMHTCGVKAHTLAGASRYSATEDAVPSALEDAERYTDAIHALAVKYGIDTILPMTEPALLALLPNRGRFADVDIPFADASVFTSISDKQAVLEAAARVGIAIPAQLTLETASDADALDTSALSYPLVVKPARSVSTGSGKRIKVSVSHAGSASDLRAALAATDPKSYPVLLQQRVVGPGVGIFVLVWNGTLVAQFAHRRIREQPPSGGISVYRESIDADPHLVARSVELLRTFDWNGVAMIEYKLDAHTGTPYLMEINGRFWGSLQLAIDSGVDFPRLLLDVESGKAPAEVPGYRSGVRSRWFWGDVDHVIARIRKSDAKLSLPEGAPSRMSAIRNFFTWHPDDVSEIFRRDDVRPFIRESLQWFQQLGK